MVDDRVQAEAENLTPVPVSQVLPPAKVSLAPSTPAFKLTPVSALELIKSHATLRPEVISGILREGEVLNIVSDSKVGKSWLAHSLAMAIASGSGWLGMATKQGQVLLVDGELHHETVASRLAAVAKHEGLGDEALGNVHVVVMRGAGVKVDDLRGSLAGISRRYRLIILDPIYRLQPSDFDENDNRKMTALYDTLDAIALETGASVVVVHHNSKGDNRSRKITDMGAGAGAQSRAADSHVTIRDSNIEGTYILEGAVRSFPKPSPVAIRWNNPGWSLAVGVDASLIRKTAGRDRATKKAPVEWTPQRFAEVIVGTTPVIKDTILAAAKKDHSITNRDSVSLLKRAENEGLVERINTGHSSSPEFAYRPPAKR